MEAGFVVVILVALLLAVLFFLFGLAIGKMRNESNDTHGILNVDCSDPADGTYLYLNLSVPVAEIANQKRVTFDVHIIR